VTVFNRGLTRLDFTRPVTQLIGDRRSSDLSLLAQGRWDAVVDVCGYTVAEVSNMAQVLGSRVAHYCFISTGAVYADMSQPLTEDSRLVEPFRSVPDEADLVSHYAELKVACEQELQRLVGPRLSIVRLGVVVGPDDYTDRLTYWVRRVDRGGTMLGPPRAEQPLQLLHSGDLAACVLRIVTAAESMCVNLAGPVITFADLLAACVTASGSDATVVWGGPADLPLATPADGSHDGAYQMSSTTGLVGANHRSLVETCLEVLGWDSARGRPPLKKGPSSDTEHELISQLTGGGGHVLR
jgi:2'-hydroxyisoflavone reductase